MQQNSLVPQRLDLARPPMNTAARLQRISPGRRRLSNWIRSSRLSCDHATASFMAFTVAGNAPDQGRGHVGVQIRLWNCSNRLEGSVL